MAVKFKKWGSSGVSIGFLTSVVIPPIECPLACVMSVSKLRNLAQYELKQKN